MRIAALYDIHGNLPALDAVLGDAREAGVDHLVIGGDVLPGPMPRESLARLLEFDLPVRFIHGNGDRAVWEYRDGGDQSALPEHGREPVRWSAEQLDDEDVRRLRRWPPTLTLEIDGIGRVLFCHATPRNDTEIFTRLTAEERLREVFAGLDVALVVCGHTHMPFDRQVGPIRVVNPGSVGMPFGEAGAHWLLLGPGVERRRTPYDLAAAAERIRASGFPQADAFAQYVLEPLAESAMLERYSQSELRP
jgi:putative phosphoesterase